MNGKIIFPNNPLFFLQFIIFPAVLISIGEKMHFTLKSTVALMGATKLTLIIFCYFLLVLGIVLNSLVMIDDISIRGPAGGFRFFPLTLPFKGAEYSIEKRRTGRLVCDCLIIRNKLVPGTICLPDVYFTKDFFDQIINLIRKTNEEKKTEV